MTREVVDRRRAIHLLGVIAFLPITSWATGQKQAPILINGDGIKDVRGLVAEMRKRAGPLLPAKLTSRQFYTEILKVAVANAHRAADAGIKVPAAIMKMAKKKSGTWSMSKVQMPIMILIPIFGVFFAMPLSAFFVIVIASLSILMSMPSGKKEEPPEPSVKKQNGRVIARQMINT